MNVISRIHQPELAFAHDFRRHVLPQLSRHMPVSAVLVALNRAGFAEVYDSIVRDAWNLGGWFLPDPIWHDLEDWIADELADAITNIEAEIGEDWEDAELTYFPPDRNVFAEYAAICKHDLDLDYLPPSADALPDYWSATVHYHGEMSHA
jgi:hypothetical protein